jgi:mono/diheme cytochrome c family protein
MNGAAAQKNPFAGDMAEDVLLTGQKFYETNCMICHGAKGLGDGTVVPRFAAPPNLTAANARNLSDAQIYELITKGRGRMGAYGGNVTRQDRWKVIHYIRTLQNQ